MYSYSECIFLLPFSPPVNSLDCIFISCSCNGREKVINLRVRMYSNPPTVIWKCAKTLKEIYQSICFYICYFFPAFFSLSFLCSIFNDVYQLLYCIFFSTMSVNRLSSFCSKYWYTLNNMVIQLYFFKFCFIY